MSITLRLSRAGTLKHFGFDCYNIYCFCFEAVNVFDSELFKWIIVVTNTLNKPVIQLGKKSTEHSHYVSNILIRKSRTSPMEFYCTQRRSIILSLTIKHTSLYILCKKMTLTTPFNLSAHCTVNKSENYLWLTRHFGIWIGDDQLKKIGWRSVQYGTMSSEEREEVKESCFLQEHVDGVVLTIYNKILYVWSLGTMKSFGQKLPLNGTCNINVHSLQTRVREKEKTAGD